jgi:16S rRNA pseudouridine516 synthase
MPDRLDQYLSHRGFGTRSEVRTLIRQGRVRLDGRKAISHGQHVGQARVTVHGIEVPVGILSATLLLHKPLGYACSHDEAERPLVDELIPPAYAHLGLNTAGRLDRDTSGLLLFTDDGALIHRLTSPKLHRSKRYRIVYSGTLSSHAIERTAKGLHLADDPIPCLPARLRLEDDAPDGLHQATLILDEGRYHQVRRMIAELGGHVERLHRDRIGGLDLPADLAPGEAREITPEELELLQRGEIP